MKRKSAIVSQPLKEFKDIAGSLKTEKSIDIEKSDMLMYELMYDL